jgi:hypothetical protein
VTITTIRRRRRRRRRRMLLPLPHLQQQHLDGGQGRVLVAACIFNA